MYSSRAKIIVREKVTGDSCEDMGLVDDTDCYIARYRRLKSAAAIAEKQSSCGYSMMASVSPAFTVEPSREDLLHLAVFRRLHLVLHLHGFHDDDALPGLDFVPFVRP